MELICSGGHAEYRLPPAIILDPFRVGKWRFAREACAENCFPAVITLDPFQGREMELICSGGHAEYR